MAIRAALEVAADTPRALAERVARTTERCCVMLSTLRAAPRIACTVTTAAAASERAAK